MRRRPLLRAAMVGGGAYVAGKHAGRGAEQDAQQQQAAPQAQAAPPAPAGGMSDTAIEQLEKLAKLRDQGILTSAEFEVQKAKLLA